MAFDDDQFPPTISFGMVGGPAFNTSVIVSTEGYEHRNRHWQLPLRSFDCAQRIRKQYELDQLVEFFYARGGAARGFRFKDWIDYKHDMSSTPAAQSCYPATGDGTNVDFQLVKTYSDAAFSHLRPITKPVASTVTIYVNGAPQTGGGVDYTLDDATGGVVFEPGSIPPNTHTVTWEGEFDVPARFEGDDMPVSIEHFELYNWGSIRIMETREDSYLAVPQTVSTSGFHDVRLPEKVNFGVTGGPRFQTVVTATTGGRESRLSQWADSRNSYQASHELQDFDEFTSLLGFFHARYGKAFSFRFKDWSDYRQRMSAPKSPVPLYSASSQPLAEVQANLAEIPMTGPVNGTDVQMVKGYTSGPQTYYRDVTKPVSGTIYLYRYLGLTSVIASPYTEGVDYTLDYATGLISWLVEVYDAGLQARLFWEGEFDNHVRLDTDQMGASLTGHGRFDWNAISVVEVRE